MLRASLTSSPIQRVRELPLLVAGCDQFLSGDMSHPRVRHELVRPADLAVLAHELICHWAWNLECLGRCVIEIEADR
jgi:hypothetical protein